jgi:hypothetical protein
MDRRIAGLIDPGAIAKLEEGDIPGAGRRIIKTLAGTPDDLRDQVADRIYGEVVQLLTGPRGQAAIDQANELVRLLMRSDQAEPLARRIGDYTEAAAATAGYQARLPMQER